MTPERRLWASVFEVAVRDLCAVEHSPERRDALVWLGTRDFTFVCWAVGIDPEAAHARLRALAARPDRLAYARRAFGAPNATRQHKRTLRHAA